MSKRTFLICPVRRVDLAETAGVVARLESEGWQVHWPPRDTNQDDPHGLQICRDNLAAIYSANCVHFIWDGKSQGCLFDLGMAFALHKRIVPVQMPELTPHKSFQNMVKQWSKGTPCYYCEHCMACPELRCQLTSSKRKRNLGSLKGRAVPNKRDSPPPSWCPLQKTS